MARAIINKVKFRSRRLTIVARYAVMLLLIVMAALLVSAMGYAGLRPFIKGQASSRALAELEHTVEKTRLDRDEMRATNEWLKSPEGAYEVNRKNGLVKPGEHAVRVEVIPAEPVPPTVATTPTTFASPIAGLAALFVLAFGIGILWFVRRRRPAVAPHSVGVLTPRSQLPRRRD